MDPVNADRSLLTTLHERASAPEELYACINAHGLYNRVQYVLRLSPEVHRRLSRFSTQILKLNRVAPAEMQAFSTLLHETLHWWQHIGSTAGLMLSLSTPLQSHASFPHLRMFLQQVGPKKSILKFAMTNASNSQAAPAMRTTNIIVNNHKDVSFFQIIATRPDLLEKCGVAADPLFESVGHSYYITYANIVHLLSDLFDPHFAFLPDARQWESAFAAL